MAQAAEMNLQDGLRSFGRGFTVLEQGGWGWGAHTPAAPLALPCLRCRAAAGAARAGAALPAASTAATCSPRRCSARSSTSQQPQQPEQPSPLRCCRPLPLHILHRPVKDAAGGRSEDGVSAAGGGAGGGAHDSPHADGGQDGALDSTDPRELAARAHAHQMSGGGGGWGPVAVDRSGGAGLVTTVGRLPAATLYCDCIVRCGPDVC